MTEIARLIQDLFNPHWTDTVSEAAPEALTVLKRRPKMPCPTCDHTMQALAGRWFWCPRCGTLKDGSLDDTVTNYEAPKLVERCREFEAEAKRRYLSRDANNAVADLRLEWHRLGIEESIHRPEERPT